MILRAGMFALLAAVPSVAVGQPACNGTTEHLMSWPDVNPVWQFCWMRPQDSSGANGSGLEIRNVYYNGHLMLKRGHVPILNVKYESGCGGGSLCYRDWQYQEVVFIVNNVISPGYAEPSSPCPQTVCDLGGSAGDCPQSIPSDPTLTCSNPVCFTGVAAEKLADHLTLTTQFEAGWYRYGMKWTFWLDGRVNPSFSFSAVDHPCTDYNHRHHAYWRFDFDIDGPANDVVTEGPNPSPGGGRGGPRFPIVTLPTETMRVNNQPSMTWSVIDSTTRRGYRIVPGDEVALPVDTFSIGDFWALRYKANEIDDSGQSGPPCVIHLNGFVNGETTSQDTVVWYRTGAYHAGGDLDDCHAVGPTLYPIGDWSPTP